MNSEIYVSHAMRTDSPLTMELQSRLTDPDFIRLLHAGMGLCTESGEFMDMLKRHLFYGKPLDLVNAKEELGDSMWYIALAIDVISTTLNEVMTVNINKLKLRYPEKFSEVHAIERNTVAEREFLELSDSKTLEVGKIVPTIGASKRGQDYINYSREVLMHIENYTIPQYGDAPNDEISSWSVEECLKDVSKRLSRYGRQSRGGQQALDFKKMAHVIQIAALKYQEEQNATR